MASELVRGPRHEELRKLVNAESARVGGQALWLQGAEHDGSFLMQFDEQFVNVNLGDARIMYLFEDTAFWQWPVASGTRE